VEQGADSARRRAMGYEARYTEEYSRNTLRSVDYHPELIRAHRGLSRLAFKTLSRRGEERDRSDEALPMVLRAVALMESQVAESPDVPEYGRILASTCNSLAWFFATSPDSDAGEIKEAVELAERAVALGPETGQYWNTLGAAQYREGTWEAAVTSLEKSCELLGDEHLGSNAFFLAMSYWQMGKEEEARQWYTKGVRWMEQDAPEDEELRRFRQDAAQLLGISDGETRD